MTTLRELAERTIRDLVGGDIPQDSPYDIDYVIQAWRDVMRADLKLESLTKRHGSDDDKSAIAQFLATYKVDVQKPNDEGFAFATLPDYFQTLKHNGGIYGVSFKKNGILTPMIRTDHASVSRQLSHVNELAGATYIFFIEGMTVQFLRDILKDRVTEVFIKLLTAAPDKFGPDDVLPIIPDNIFDMMTKVKLQIQNKTQQDRIADGNPNLRATNEQPR
jgi:hypothetical protein